MTNANEQARPTRQSERSGWRWAFTICLIAIVLVGSWYGQPYVAAAVDPARRARVSIEQVRIAERTLTARLEAIKTRFGKNHSDKLSLVVDSAGDLQAASVALREIGEWLLQERGPIETDIAAYVAAMERATVRIQSAIEQCDETAKKYPEGSEFRGHYQKMSAEYAMTSSYLQQRIMQVRKQQQELDRSMDYVVEVLRFLDRMEFHVEIVAIRHSDEGRRVEQYLSTLTAFRTQFQTLMTLLGSEQIEKSQLPLPVPA